MTTVQAPPTKRPPVVRAKLGNYRALLDRRRTIAMFEGFAARYPDLMELHLGRRRIWLVSNRACSLRIRVLTAAGATRGNSSTSRRSMSASSVSSPTWMVWPTKRNDPCLFVIRQTGSVVSTRATGCECDDCPMGDYQPAQAVELVRALCHQLP